MGVSMVYPESLPKYYMSFNLPVNELLPIVSKRSVDSSKHTYLAECLKKPWKLSEFVRCPPNGCSLLITLRPLRLVSQPKGEKYSTMSDLLTIPGIPSCSHEGSEGGKYYSHLIRLACIPLTINGLVLVKKLELMSNMIKHIGDVTALPSAIIQDIQNRWGFSTFSLLTA